MSEEEFNQTVKETSNDFRNKQPDEFEHPVEIHQYEEDNRKLPSNPKKGSKKPSASSFLFLVVGASVTVGGIGIAIPELQNNKVDIKIENVQSDKVSFSFISNSMDLSARVYNDFEDVPCNVEYTLQNEGDQYYGYGYCESLRENTDYTITLDGASVLGNASRGKKSFRTEKKPTTIKELSGISITGELIKKEYFEGESFDPSGLMVIAEFTDATHEDVTSVASWNHNPLTLNDTSISVSYTYNEITKTAEFTDFVVKPVLVPVTGVKLSEAKIGMVAGETHQLETTVLPLNATNKRVSYSSSNNSVATIDSNGLVRAISAGTAIVSVTTQDGDYTAACSVSVENEIIHVTGVEFTEKTLEKTVGEEFFLTYNVLPGNASNKDVRFTLSNEQCATVTDNGCVHAYAAGETTIKVKTVDGGYEDQLLLKVNKEHTWQDDVEINVTFERMNENILHYSIDAKQEIYNISSFKFMYYSMDDELIDTIIQYVKELPSASTTVDFFIDVSNIEIETFYDILFVTRNGEEEALGYSSQYTPKEMFTHPEDIVVTTDNSLIDENNILYFNLELDDPYDFYSNLRGVIDGMQLEINAIIDEGSKTSGYFFFSPDTYFPKVSSMIVKIYIEYSGEECEIFNESVELYKSIPLDSLSNNVEMINTEGSIKIYRININTEFYDYVNNYGDYICELCDEDGLIVNSKTYSTSEWTFSYNFMNVPLDQSKIYNLSLCITYKGVKTILKTIENVTNI